MECDRCTKEIKPTKNNFKKELEFKKGTLKDVTQGYSVFESIFSIFKKRKTKTFIVIDNIYSYYIICDVCGTKNYTENNGVYPEWDTYSGSLFIPLNWKYISK